MKDFQHLLNSLLQKSNTDPTANRFTGISLGLLFGCLVFFISAQILSEQAEILTPRPDPITNTPVADYPILERTTIPEVSAQAAYVMDEGSKVVLYAKNENLRFSPASTTKIMTALTGLDEYKLNQILTIKRSNVIPVIVGFPQGVGVTFENLLYGMFLPSGNDAAYAIADNDPGGMGGFVAKMNQKTKDLHLTNTHFGDSVGLLDDEDYTTVRDLALLGAEALKNPIIARIADTKEKMITDSVGNVYDLKNINKLLGLYGVIGLKTGYTEEAGEVLVTGASLKGHTYIIVVMKSDDRFADTEKLLQLISQNVSYIQLSP